MVEGYKVHLKKKSKEQSKQNRPWSLSVFEILSLQVGENSKSTRKGPHWT